MSWRAVTVVFLLLAYAACTSSTEPSTTTSETRCTDPPVDELEFDSEFDISLDPNPVSPGGRATLSVDFEGQPPGDYIGGPGMTWECWNGNSWVETHILVRAFNESAQPSVIDLSADEDIAIPDIGLNVPNSFDVLVPQVAPGTYRLTDYVFGPNSTLAAYVAVEVRD